MRDLVDRQQAMQAIKEHCFDTVERLSENFPPAMREAYIMAHQHCMTVIELLPAAKAVEGKHGRLIDADALKSPHTDLAGNHFVYLVDIQEAPTIIESEGE